MTIDVSKYFPTEFKLRSGEGGGNPANGLCFMETVALIAGEDITAQPECASPALTYFGIHLNDLMPDDIRQKLLPLAQPATGTLSPEHEKQRLEIIVATGIKCELEVCSDESFVSWANKWLSGEDRSHSSACGVFRYSDSASAAIYAAEVHSCSTERITDSAAFAVGEAAGAATDALAAKIWNIALSGLREAIEAGPNGGIPESEFAPRIEAVKELLPT